MLTEKLQVQSDIQLQLLVNVRADIVQFKVLGKQTTVVCRLCQWMMT